MFAASLGSIPLQDSMSQSVKEWFEEHQNSQVACAGNVMLWKVWLRRCCYIEAYPELKELFDEDGFGQILCSLFLGANATHHSAA